MISKELSDKIRHKIKRVLIIKSCRMEQFHSNLETFKENINPEACIDVLAQPGVRDELLASDSINEVLVYDKEGFFKAKDMGKKLWQKIQENYDAFVIFYNNVLGKGYHQVNKIAALSRAKYIIGIDIEEDIFIVPYRLWWRKRLSNFFSTWIRISLITIFIIPTFVFIVLLEGIIKIVIRTYKAYSRRYYER